MNRPIEEWSVTEVDDFLRSTGMMDLSHLSHAEKLQIIRVLKRDEKLLKTETNRVLRLKHEVQDLKRRSAVKAGENDRVCVRCHSELGLIINTGAECFKCHFMVCKNCRVVVTEDGKTWLCILCAKQAKLRTISGEWFYEKVSDRLKPSVSSYVHGSNFVRDSLRLKNRNSRDTGVVPFTSNSSGNSPVATKRGGFPSHQPDVLAILKSRALSASGITSREGSAINLDGDSDSSGKERDPGERPEKTALDSDGNPEWSRSRLCAEIQRGFADNYEHEQSNRRSSLQGANSEDSANDSGANAHNTTGASTNITGSNSSLQASMPGLELGSRHPGYSCSVPATPEHRRHLATSEWAPAGHPGVPYPTRGVPLGDAYSMGRGRRGIPYAYRSHGPRMGGAAAANARVPFRHPSQYRSLPTHGYGFYPRVRGRPMTPVHASSRFSSQEDFRGSSKSLAVYPSSGDYRSPDMRMMRGRVGGSRESLDSQAMQQASRESRSLNKSYPVDNRQGRSTSLPPTEDRLGEEDEAVLSRLAADPLLSSNHVPSFIRSLTPPGTATDRGGQTPPHTITAEGGVSPYLPHYQQGDTPQTENKAVERKEKQRKRSTSLTHKFSSALHSLSGSLKTGKREVTTSQSSLSRPPSSDPATDLASSGLEARSSLDTISQTDWGGSLKWKKSLSGSQTSLGSLGSIKEQLRKNSRRFRSHIDKEGSGKEKAPSKKSVSVVDRGKEVVHMFIQNEDEMVASSTENKFLLGCVQFSFDYDIKKARLNLRNLSFASLNSTGNKLCTPYAKLTLKSTNGKISKVKTKVSKPTTDVCFDEQLQFPVAETDINSASLRISAWNKTSIGKDTLMGEVEVNLSNWKNWQGSIERFPLTIYALNENRSGSSVKLTVKFVPKESIDIRIAVSSLSKKAFNEPNTMCKLHLLPLTKSYKTQEVRGCDPVYLQTFSIPINSHSLSDFCLELAIFSLGLHAHSKSFIGGVRLSDGTAVCRGALVEWMQSTGEEIEMWQKIQNMSGQWVQVRLPLRSNFSPLK